MQWESKKACSVEAKRFLIFIEAHLWKQVQEVRGRVAESC